MLKELKNKDIKLSVATNAPTKFARTMLLHLNAANLFDIIIGVDRVSASKPDPKMLNFILNFYKYDKEKDRAWIVGDNSKDMQSAEINAIFATWGFSPQSPCEVVINEPKEMFSIVL